MPAPSAISVAKAPAIAFVFDARTAGVAADGRHGGVLAVLGGGLRDATLPDRPHCHDRTTSAGMIGSQPVAGLPLAWTWPDSSSGSSDSNDPGAGHARRRPGLVDDHPVARPCLGRGRRECGSPDEPDRRHGQSDEEHEQGKQVAAARLPADVGDGDREAVVLFGRGHVSFIGRTGACPLPRSGDAIPRAAKSRGYARFGAGGGGSRRPSSCTTTRPSEAVPLSAKRMGPIRTIRSHFGCSPQPGRPSCLTRRPT